MRSADFVPPLRFQENAAEDARDDSPGGEEGENVAEKRRKKGCSETEEAKFWVLIIIAGTASLQPKVVDKATASPSDSIPKQKFSKANVVPSSWAAQGGVVVFYAMATGRAYSSQSDGKMGQGIPKISALRPMFPFPYYGGA